jgi:hypothetical protein
MSIQNDLKALLVMTTWQFLSVERVDLWRGLPVLAYTYLSMQGVQRTACTARPRP